MKENWEVHGLIVVLSAVVWVGSFAIHDHFLSFLEHAPGIDIVFIPSGVRMIAILIGGIWAVLGVGVGSLFLTATEFKTVHLGTILAVAAGSGLFPYIALRLSLRATGVQPSLENLTPARLPLVSLGVAIGSAVLHNLLFRSLGLETWSSFAEHVVAMATGDFVGILLAVIIAFLVLRATRRTKA